MGRTFPSTRAILGGTLLAAAALLLVPVFRRGVRSAGETAASEIDGSASEPEAPARARKPGPVPLPPGCDYPAAQALAAGIVAGEAVAHAGSTAPDALWDAARALRTRTLIGPFAVDATGRQTGHAPAIVRWERGPDGPRRMVVWRPTPGSRETLPP